MNHKTRVEYLEGSFPQKHSFSLLALSTVGLTNLLNRKSRALTTIIGITLSVTLLSNILFLFQVDHISGGSEDIILLREYQIWLALISIVIGMIGIGNSVLLAILERITEIGTLRTSGCSKIQISYLFLFELFILSIIGGFTGCISGIFAIFLLSYSKEAIERIFDIFIAHFIEIFGFLVLSIVILAIIITLISSIPALLKGSRFEITEALIYRV